MQPKSIEYLKPRWGHQAACEDTVVAQYLIERAAARDEGRDPVFGYGIFFEPGTGKTGTAINILRRLCKIEGRFLRTLIFCPPVVCKNWKEEFAIHSRVDQRKIQVISGDGEVRLKKFTQLAFDHMGDPNPGIFITNYESLCGKVGGPMDQFLDAMLKWRPEVLIFDESHELKERTTKRAMAADKLANPNLARIKKCVPRPVVLELSGSPILNSEQDLFSQFLVLDGGQSFGTNFFEFRAEFFQDKNANWKGQRRFPDWQVKPDTQERVQRIISAKSMVAYKKDCLDLPPLLKQTTRLDMTKEQRRHYDEMEQHLVTYYDDDACVAELALTKTLRLMQIASGFMKFEDGTELGFKENPKKAALFDILGNVAGQHKVLVWAVWKYDYVAIKEVCDKLKLPFVSLHGGMDDESRYESIRALNQDPKVRVCVGHPGSGGVGANLQASSYSVNYSLDFRRLHRVQSAARNYRGGSEIHEKITHMDLVIHGSIEEQVIAALDRKDAISVRLLKSFMKPKNKLLTGVRT